MSHKGQITAQHIWKRFPVDKQRLLLRDELSRLRGRLRGTSQRGYRWALRDVSLEVEPGESVGIVGVNGSGKSTFLKILTRVMYPYAGRVNLTGRVAALIEIRAGIHPDLTGRENVYLYGSLLGLRRREVTQRFDEIVEFAELTDAIERQVKFYSSGMQMRLAFSVAAFLQPDTLLVDEVFAVGDAAFQQKCLDRMQMLLREGTTLVFVSHDLAAVEATCSRGLWLHDGIVEAAGKVRDVLGAYRHRIEEIAHASSHITGVVQLRTASLAGLNGDIRTQQPLTVRVQIESPDPRSAGVILGMSEGPATPIFVLRRDLHLKAGVTEVQCRIRSLPLPRGRYYFWMGVFDQIGNELLAWHPVSHFDVIGPDLDAPPWGIVRLAPIHVDAAWQDSEEPAMRS